MNLNDIILLIIGICLLICIILFVVAFCMQYFSKSHKDPFSKKDDDPSKKDNV